MAARIIEISLLRGGGWKRIKIGGAGTTNADFGKVKNISYYQPLTKKGSANEMGDMERDLVAEMAR